MQCAPSPWFCVLPGGSHPPALRLYCFPYAGAGHTVFQHWRAGLMGNIELALVKLPGRGARFSEPRADSLNELAEVLAWEIAQASVAGVPFAFFGHSMGALLAFETARKLARQSLAPTMLPLQRRTASDLPHSGTGGRNRRERTVALARGLGPGKSRRLQDLVVLR